MYCRLEFLDKLVTAVSSNLDSIGQDAKALHTFCFAVSNAGAGKTTACSHAADLLTGRLRCIPDPGQEELAARVERERAELIRRVGEVECVFVDFSTKDAVVPEDKPLLPSVSIGARIAARALFNMKFDDFLA